MSVVYRRVLRPLMFLMEPEQAHKFAVFWLQILAQTPIISALGCKAFQVHNPKSVFGINFPNPVGLAAGFDKDAEALPAWEMLGFGHIEIGTVTAKAQPGNPQPRCFRYPARQALINRMGFNNQGAKAIAARLKNYQDTGRWPKIPIGINIGKSKVTELADATSDYLFSFNLLQEYADYFVVNVSSPNTPGLRSLQATDTLKPLLVALHKANQTKIPILVKIAPDLEQGELAAIVELAQETGMAGLIATNTTLDHSAISESDDQQGGLSGRPLAQKSTEILSYITSHTSLPVVASGGVMDVATARDKFAAGASLVQLYTGFIYSGPSLIKQIAAFDR